MNISVTFPIDELQRVRALTSILDDDERTGIGQIRLSSDGHNRRWIATDSYRAVLIDVPAVGPSFEIGLSPAAVQFITTLAAGSIEATLETYEDGNWVRAHLRSVSGSVWWTDLEHDYPDVPGIVPSDDNLPSSATVEALPLFEMLRSAMQGRERDENNQFVAAPCKLAISNGEVVMQVDWPETGSIKFAIDADDVSGNLEVQLNPRLLRSLVELFEPDDQLQLQIPAYNSQPVVLRCGDTTAMLMTFRNQAMVVEDQVKELIDTVCGRLALVRDADGDFPLQRRSTPVFGRLVFDTDPMLLQVFAVVLDGIESSDDLYRELNDLNSHSTFARLFHVDNQVLVEVDLVAGTLDEDELRTAIHRIREVAETIMPTLSAVLGGNLVADPAEVRLSAYRSAVIEAEVTPGDPVALNGPDGLLNWPFPGPVHVLTGWNPQGVSLGDQRHENINLRIAEDIIRRGGRFVHGEGRSPSGDHTEPSLIAWGLSRADAIDMGRRADQDAIFELDDDEVRLVSCIGDRVDVWPRHA